MKATLGVIGTEGRVQHLLGVHDNQAHPDLAGQVLRRLYLLGRDGLGERDGADGAIAQGIVRHFEQQRAVHTAAEGDQD